MSSKPPNAGTRTPHEYIEMMRHYLPPEIPLALITDAWKHNATPMEVIRYLDAAKEQGK